jgi:malonate transporter and related proteins
MNSVLSAFGIITVVIVVGIALGRSGVLGPTAHEVLSRTVFYVAAPALLFTTLAEADVADVLSVGLAVAGTGASIALVSYMTIARLIWKQPIGDSLVGGWASSYVNAGNLGIPIAVYAFGDAALVAPVMLFQIVVLAPLGFAILDASAEGDRPRASLGRRLVQPLANPIMIGTAAGLVVSATGWRPPTVAWDAMHLLAGLAVPAALIAFGLSWALEPWPGLRGLHRGVVLVAVLKLLLQPTVAYLLARFAFGLDGAPLAAATVCGALPTGTHVFVYAVKYGRAVTLARDAVLVTTILSVPVIVVIATLVA